MTPGAERGAAAGAFHRALRDRRFRAAFLARYDGDADPMDALWWLDHPETEGPSGARPPDVVAAEARRDLYRVRTNPVDVARVEELIARTEHASERTRAAVLQAEDALRSSDRARPDGRRRMLLVIGVVASAAVVVTIVAGHHDVHPVDGAASGRLTRVFPGPAVASAASAVLRASDDGLPRVAARLHGLADPALERSQVVRSGVRRGTGDVTVAVDGFDDFGTMNRISLLLVCPATTEVSVSVRATEPAGAYRTRTVVVMSRPRTRCGRSPAVLTAGLIKGEIPVSVRVRTPEGAVVVVAAAESA